MKAKKNILLVAAECAPLAKTGGLADVVGTLPSYLNRMGFDCQVMIPYHRCIKDKYGDQVRHLTDFWFNLGWRSQYVGLEQLDLNGVTVYLLDNEYYFGQRIYLGGDQEIEQYAWFSRAVCDVLQRMDFRPDLLHLNDWHTAVIPLLLKTQYSADFRGGLKTLLTIHNIAYQGKTSFGLVQDLLGVDRCYFTSEFMESYGAADFLKAGCVFADAINVPSPTNAREVCTPEYGYGLEGILSARGGDLHGILNGIDRVSYDPARDPCLPARYSADRPAGKAKCKQALLYELGLNVDPETPLFGMVSRLVYQKGLDLIVDSLNWLMEQGAALVVVGTGEAGLETLLRAAESRFRGRLCSYIAYDEGVSRRVYAGSDFFLMPSRFEPCGLAQMIAMRYGTLPIVRETGGLRDTVIPYNRFTGEGTGFSFTNYDGFELRGAIARALDVYRDKPALRKMIGQAMAADFSFGGPAREYAAVYDSLIS
ncbi:MAG: glycogen synthase [Firmicutes bacterium]|nr:glycogen synthase [Bacillota bacterium]